MWSSVCLKYFFLLTYLLTSLDPKHIVMGRYYLLIVVISISGQLYAQNSPSLGSKPNIDIKDLGTWPRLGVVRISPYGRYVGYEMTQASSREHRFVIEDSAVSWKKVYAGVTDCTFSLDERLAIFQQGDTLHFLSLGNDGTERKVRVNRVRQPKGQRGGWIAYSLKDSSARVILLNLLTGKEVRIDQVSDFQFDKAGRGLLMEGMLQDSGTIMALRYLKMEDGKMAAIWTGKIGDKIDNSFFDGDSLQIIFEVSEKTSNRDLHSIWHYIVGEDKAHLLIRDGDSRISAEMVIAGQPQLSKNGHWVFFALRQLEQTKSLLPKDAVSVDVWSYKDRVLQPAQMFRNRNRVFLSVVSVIGDNFQQLIKGDEDLKITPRDVIGNNIMIVCYDTSNRQPGASGSIFCHDYYLVDLRDGSRKLLKRNKIFDYDIDNCSFSPGGKWLVYYDVETSNYLSYNLQTGRVWNITRRLPGHATKDYSNGIFPTPAGPVAGWMKDDSGVLLYDNYDLWNVDPDNSRPPINITGGYGATHRIKLRLVHEEDDAGIFFLKDDTLLFTGFNVLNKYNGFYRKILGSRERPEQLVAGPYTFYRTESQKPHKYSFDDGMPPVKALNVGCWIIKRQSDREAPNYFITQDFKNYRPVSQEAPQSRYNWLTSELVTWRQFDGTYSEGILYKPENFDPAKKYPVIFNYYEQLSHRLFEFPVPELTAADINIPWFVSRGYLVFTPDIYFQNASKSGKPPGYWVYNSVVSAAIYLAKLPFIDGRRMGLQGHSFGGGETNYLVTHTHIFAAAAEAAGVSDLISGYLTLLLMGQPTEMSDPQPGIETSHDKLGTTLWRQPNLYLGQSAVLRADHVTTPLLIMHNKMDEQIQWRQGVELYMALRRLGKKVWMLQYDEGTHVLYGKDRLDYTIRLTQFFDYYLQGALPPVWMTEGMDVRLKGMQTGYEMDGSGRIP